MNRNDCFRSKILELNLISTRIYPALKFFFLFKKSLLTFASRKIDAKNSNKNVFCKYLLKSFFLTFLFGCCKAKSLRWLRLTWVLFWANGDCFKSDKTLSLLWMNSCCCTHIKTNAEKTKDSKENKFVQHF